MNNKLEIALVGNPNCGKTTLFNALTGNRQYTGNWPGVTVERLEGYIKTEDADICLVDLPGVYSLEPTSPEEKVTREYLCGGGPGLILNVIDTVNLERSLLLTFELIALGKPILLVLNMADELEKSGMELNVGLLERYLGVRGLFISASSGDGVMQLRALLSEAEKGSSAFLPKPEKIPCGSNKNVVTAASYIVSRVITGNLKISDFAELSDKLLTNRIFSVPFFLCVIALVFFITFGSIGASVTEWSSWFCSVPLVFAFERLLCTLGASDILRSIITDGIIGGIGSVLSFFPQISILFICLSCLEESGLMSRAAYAFDPFFRIFGLSGKTVIPMTVGFGCSVPAVMACRAQDGEDERRALASFVSFVPCSARTPVFALMASCFFPRGMFTAGIYAVGIFAALLMTAASRRAISGAGPAPFLMELPKLRIPSPLSVLCSSWSRVRGFLIKAGTVVFTASVLIWAAGYFTPGFLPAEAPEESLLAFGGKLLVPILSPLGFFDWKACASLISGIVAKESVVSTLGILSDGELSTMIAGTFSRASACSFSVFVLLYCPCAATFAAMRKELGGTLRALCAALIQLTLAFVISFITYRAALLLC